MKKLKISGLQTDTYVLGEDKFLLENVQELENGFYLYPFLKNKNFHIDVLFRRKTLFRKNIYVYLNDELFLETSGNDEKLLQILINILEIFGESPEPFYLRNHKMLKVLCEIYNKEFSEIIREG